MPINFNQVPAGSRIPFVYVEIDPRNAGATGRRFRTLVIGQRLAAGVVPANAPRAMGSEAAAVAAFGQGSMLAHMVRAFHRSNPRGELWAVALDDKAGATKAEITVTVTAAATGGGTIALYIAGRRVPVNISGAAAVNAVAAAIKTAIDAQPGLPVTAAAAAGVVTLTARHGGAAPDIDVRLNYHPDEALPAGVKITIATATAGATDPSLMGAIAAIADQKFDLIVTPYTGVAEVVELETELAARFGPGSALQGSGIGAYRGAGGTAAQATTYGNARNSPVLSIAGVGKVPVPTYEWAASVAGQVAFSAEVDPAVPFQDLPLPGMLPPEVGARWSPTTRNTLLHDGISTYYVDEGGVPHIERMITTYQTAPGGVPDEAYLDLNTVLTLDYLRTSFRNRIRRKFSRYKLADDGKRRRPGSRIITPRIGLAEMIAWGSEMYDQGFIENFDEFKEGAICERNARDKNRLDFFGSPNLINQFRIGAAQIAFEL